MKATAILLVILIFLLLLGETSGDFANGLILFLAAIFKIQVIIHLIILFGLTYFFGSMAGEEIIIEEKNFLLISVKYVALISLSITIYSISVRLIREAATLYDFQNLLKIYFLPLFMKCAFSFLIV